MEDQLLTQSFDVPFPLHVSKSMLANEMANFFFEKISNMRSKFHECTIQDCQACAPIMELHSPSFIGSFKAITEDETYSSIMNLVKKSCALDHIPTPPCWSSALMSFYQSKLKLLIFHLKVAIFPQHGRGFGSTDS